MLASIKNKLLAGEYLRLRLVGLIPYLSIVTIFAAGYRLKQSLYGSPAPYDRACSNK